MVSISISIAQNSQSVSNNTSNVTVNVIAKWTGGSWNSTGECYGSITIDGTAYSFTGIKFNTSATTSGSQTIMTKTVDVNHNTDGSKTLNCSASFYTGLSSSGTQTASASKVLTTIPKATTPTVSGSLSLGSTITISTAGSASTSFTHNLYYSWGSQITDSLIASGVTTSKSWVIPKTLAEYIQGGISGTMFLKCVTYSGSTVIGTKTLTLTITVPNTAEFQPTIQSVSAVEANELPIARYVSGKSCLTFTISAVGGYVSGSSNRNSYLVKANVQIDGANYSIALNQNSPSTFSITTSTLVKSGALYAIVTVTDSRGRSATMSYAYTVFEYLPPEITSFTVNRCLANGTLSESGTYILVGLKTTISSVDNCNAKTYKIVYESNGTEITLKSGTLSAYANNVISYNSYSSGVTFSVDYAWPVRVYVYDSFNSDAPAVASVIVPTEGTFMDWRDNGKGFAFGKVSTRDGFQCGWNMYDKFDGAITNGLVQYTGSGDNAIDPNTTIEHLVLTNKNTPTTEFWYITTLFYSTKSATANRVQYALRYMMTGSMFMRVYQNGTWYGWVELPIIEGDFDVGIWHVTRWSDKRVELTGTYDISNMACTTALGGWYRTAVFTPNSFPIDFAEVPTVTANYESDGYGALLWATTTATPYKPPSYYLIRPTSATIASGKVTLHVVGKQGTML